MVLKHFYSFLPIIALRWYLHWSIVIFFISFCIKKRKIQSAWCLGVYTETKVKQGFAKPFYVSVHATKYVDTFHLGMECIFIITFSKLLHISVILSSMFCLNVSIDQDCCLTTAYFTLLGKEDYQNHPFIFCALALILTSRKTEHIYSFLRMKGMCCCEYIGWLLA